MNFESEALLWSGVSSLVIGATHMLGHRYFGYTETASMNVGLTLIVVTFLFAYWGMTR